MLLSSCNPCHLYYVSFAMNNKELPARSDAIHGVVLPLKCDVNDPSPLAWIRNLKDAVGPYKARLYIGVDDCDYDIWREWEDEARDALGLLQVSVQVFERSKPAKICKIWSLLGRRAVQDGCQYVILWGDDVRIDYPQDFLPSLHLALDCDELGCAAPIDASDPSVPTFPIVTVKHFNVFKALFPADFINQDADVYIFELYRRIGRSFTLSKTRIMNSIGGVSEEPRYCRQHLKNWQDAHLEPNATSLKKHSQGQHPITIDVVVPTFRMSHVTLAAMVQTPSPPGICTRFILIADNPNSENLAAVISLQSPRVRVRVNETNVGASASRTRGLKECAAEWVLFLDDDVWLTTETLGAYGEAIERSGRDACGFVGNVRLPETTLIREEGTRMSYITYFFEQAASLTQSDVHREASVPWGVTANLLVRRLYAVPFGMNYSTTGGGEDIDFCLEVKRKSGKPLIACARAEVIHPWWPAATTFEYVKHFFEWTQGDGHLLSKFPEHAYRTFPNAVEMSLFAACLSPNTTCFAIRLAAIWILEVSINCVMALRGPCSRHLRFHRRVAAALYSTAIKTVVDVGHLVFHLKRGKVQNMMLRFDWFCGSHGSVTRNNERRRALMLFVPICIVFRYCCC